MEPMSVGSGVSQTLSDFLRQKGDKYDYKKWKRLYCS